MQLTEMSSQQMTRELAQLQEQRRLIKDRVRGVRIGANPGMFLCGPPGTGKSFTVLEACRETEQSPFLYYRGHITSIGLFELIAQHPDATIVLDDVHSILDEPKALQILLAAYGASDADDGARTIRYKRCDHECTIHFRGGLIAISNLELRSGKERQRQLLNAIASRIHVLKFIPSNDQMTAMMFDLASRGWKDSIGKRSLQSETCMEIAKFLVEECRQASRQLDLRLLVDKAFPDYWLWSTRETDNHWHQLVRTSLHEMPVRSNAGDVDRMADERAIVKRICSQFSERTDRIEAWKAESTCAEYPTGKSERAFYRRKAELDRNTTLNREIDTDSSVAAGCQSVEPSKAPNLNRNSFE